MKRLALFAALALTAPALAEAQNSAPVPPVAVRPATNYYPPEANAAAQVEGALAEARAGGRMAVLVFGADWCSDSVALAIVLKSEAFRAKLGDKFNPVFIDVNRPTRGEGRNQDLVNRLGIDKMTGTPEMLVIGRDGKPLNTIADAHSWRDAGNRGIDAIFAWFRALIAPPSKV